MLVSAPTTIGPTSALRSQQNSTLEPAPRLTRPRNRAVRATNTLASTSAGSPAGKADPSPMRSRRRSARSATSSGAIGRLGRAGLPA